MKRVIVGTALCATAMLFGVQNVQAAGFQNMSQSATANGMGSVGAANPDEPNSSFYNPANMSFQEGFNIYIGDTIILPTTTYKADGAEEISTESAVFPPPNLHISAPIAGGFAAGVGLTLPYGLGVTWDENWVGRGGVITQQLQTFNLNPNVSYKLPGLDLSFALGAQLYYSTVELKRKIILRDDTEVLAHLGGDGTGFGATAAVMYKPTRDLSLGLNYRSGTTLSYTGQADFQGAEGTAFESSFVDQDITTEISIPHAVTLGVGYQLDKLFIEVDANYTTWSDYESVDLVFSRPCTASSNTCDPSVDKTDPPTSVIKADWNDAMAFRLGLQYSVTEALKVRAGAVYDLTPVPDETVSGALPDNNRAAFSLGAGYTIAGVRGDLSYQFVNAAQREIDNGVAPTGLYKTTAHVIGINLGYGY